MQNIYYIINNIKSLCLTIPVYGHKYCTGYEKNILQSMQYSVYFRPKSWSGRYF